MSEHESRPKRKYRPSFIWPIILIAVGMVFLLSNLGLIEEGVWNNLWRLWPVIFIAIGLDSLFRRNEIVGPVFMISLGTVFLLSSLGLIGWGAWDVLWRLWPVLLVAIGLEIMIGRRSLWVSFTVVFLIVGILGGALWIYGGGAIQGEELTGGNVNQLLEDIIQAEINISPAAGELNIYDLADSTALVKGKVSTTSNQQINIDYHASESTGHFLMDGRSLANFPGTLPWNWDLGLTDQIPLEVDFSMGAGDMNLDLSNLTLTGLDVSQGVGEVTVILADREDYRADISQAVGSIVVELPENVGVSIEISKAISSLSLPSAFEKRGDYYYSTNYDDAQHKIDLEISQAIGSILVRFEK
jgi:predicted membrane protein